MLSENKSEVPLEDRAKKAKYAPNIPMGERAKCQQNYDVGYSNVVEPTTGGGRRLNVNKPNLRGKGEEE